MNTRRALKVVHAFISRQPNQPGFGMERYAVERGVTNPPHTPLSEVGCNTVLCVAGWTCYVFKDLVDLTKNYGPDEFYFNHARDILELTDEEAFKLFLGLFHNIHGQQVELDDLTDADVANQVFLMAHDSEAAKAKRAETDSVPAASV